MARAGSWTWLVALALAAPAGRAAADGRAAALDDHRVERGAPAAWVDEDAIELDAPGDLAAAPAAPVDRPRDGARRASRSRHRGATIHVRAGVLRVLPRAESGEMVLSDVGGPASLAVENGPIAGSSAEMGAVTTAAVIIGVSYPLWGGELGVETVLAPPVTFELRGAGTIAQESLAPTVLDTVPTGIPPLGTELGRTKALPPIVTAVFRTRYGKRVRPYVGVGLSYLHTYDSRITNPTMLEVAQPRLEIADAASAVGQVGLDVHVAGRIYATLDIKALSGFATSARVENIQMRTPAFPLYEAVYVGTVAVDVTTRPVLITLGAGSSF